MISGVNQHTEDQMLPIPDIQWSCPQNHFENLWIKTNAYDSANQAKGLQRTVCPTEFCFCTFFWIKLTSKYTDHNSQSNLIIDGKPRIGSHWIANKLIIFLAKCIAEILDSWNMVHCFMYTENNCFNKVSPRYQGLKCHFQSTDQTIYLWKLFALLLS